MQLTDAMLDAAVKKAVEFGMLPEGAEFLSDCRLRNIEAVLEAALAAADEAGEIGRLTAKLEIAKQLIDVLHVRDDSCVVPCVDHPVLDVIARAIEPEFPFGRGEGVEGPAKEITRESECIEFVDSSTGQRFEVVVRPIDEE